MAKFSVWQIRNVVFILCFCSSPGWAYYDVLDNGEVMTKGNYKLTATTQLLTESGGLNIGGIFDMGFEEDFGIRVLAGFGRTDYFVGGMLKWMPIPDIDNQPAIGFNLGLAYARWNSASDLTFRGEPLVSKKFPIETATITPYVSLPIGVRMRNSTAQDDATKIAWQFAAGSQLQIEKWKNLQFMAEVGLDLNQAQSYISAAAIWYFDQEGFELK